VSLISCQPLELSPGPSSKCLQLTDSLSAHEQWKAVDEIAEVLRPKSTNRVDFIEECKSGAFDGAVAAFRTFPSITITGRIDEELLSYWPSSINFLCHNGKLQQVSEHSSMI